MGRLEKGANTLLKESLDIEEEVVIEMAHKAKTDKINKNNTLGRLKHICAQRMIKNHSVLNTPQKG